MSEFIESQKSEKSFGFVLRFQILPDDPDLFVFDEEVVVVLEALVGKTLEQGLLEVSGQPTIICIMFSIISF